MIKRVEILVTKADNLGSVPGLHMEERISSHNCYLSATCYCRQVHTYICDHILV